MALTFGFIALYLLTMVFMNYCLFADPGQVNQNVKETDVEDVHFALADYVVNGPTTKRIALDPKHLLLQPALDFPSFSL